MGVMIAHLMRDWWVQNTMSWRTFTYMAIQTFKVNLRSLCFLRYGLFHLEFKIQLCMHPRFSHACYMHCQRHHIRFVIPVILVEDCILVRQSTLHCSFRVISKTKSRHQTNKMQNAIAHLLVWCRVLYGSFWKCVTSLLA